MYTVHIVYVYTSVYTVNDNLCDQCLIRLSVCYSNLSYGFRVINKHTNGIYIVHIGQIYISFSHGALEKIPLKYEIWRLGKLKHKNECKMYITKVCNILYVVKSQTIYSVSQDKKWL